MKKVFALKVLQKEHEAKATFVNPEKVYKKDDKAVLWSASSLYGACKGLVLCK